MHRCLRASREGLNDSCGAKNGGVECVNIACGCQSRQSRWRRDGNVEDMVVLDEEDVVQR
jgi:hypothetical protein